MGLTDRLKDLTKKAEDAAAEHKDQIHDAVKKAEAAADQRTGGKYHDKIAKAGDKADKFVDKLQSPTAPSATEDSPAEPTDPASK